MIVALLGVINKTDLLQKCVEKIEQFTRCFEQDRKPLGIRHENVYDDVNWQLITDRKRVCASCALKTKSFCIYGRTNINASPYGLYRRQRHSVK